MSSTCFRLQTTGMLFTKVLILAVPAPMENEKGELNNSVLLNILAEHEKCPVITCLLAYSEMFAESFPSGRLCDGL